MIEIRFSALTTWPHGHTPDRRSRYTFRGALTR